MRSALWLLKCILIRFTLSDPEPSAEPCVILSVLNQRTQVHGTRLVPFQWFSDKQTYKDNRRTQTGTKCLPSWRRWRDHPSRLLPSNFVFIYCRFIPLLKPSFLLPSNHSLQSAVTWTEHQKGKEAEPLLSFWNHQLLLFWTRPSWNTTKAARRRQTAENRVHLEPQEHYQGVHHLLTSDVLSIRLFRNLEEPGLHPASRVRFYMTKIPLLLLNLEGQRLSGESHQRLTWWRGNTSLVPPPRRLSSPRQPLELRGERSSEEPEDVQLSSTRWTILLGVTTSEDSPPPHVNKLCYFWCRGCKHTLPTWSSRWGV